MIHTWQVNRYTSIAMKQYNHKRLRGYGAIWSFIGINHFQKNTLPQEIIWSWGHHGPLFLLSIAKL